MHAPLWNWSFPCPSRAGHGRSLIPRGGPTAELSYVRRAGELARHQWLDSVLDARLRELAIMRTAWLRRSVYEWTSHYAICVRLGMSDDEIVAVRDLPAGPGAPNAFTNLRSLSNLKMWFEP